MNRVSTKKMLLALGLLVFPFCLSGTAEAGDFVCTRPASYYYNCGNKEFPFSNFCPSEYQRECGSYSQRQRRAAEAKRAAAAPRAPRIAEPIETPAAVEVPAQKPERPVAETPKAPEVDGRDVVAPVETPIEKKPVVEVPAKTETPVAKAPDAKAEQKDDFDDVLAPAKDEPKAPVASEPAPKAPGSDAAAKPAQDPQKPAADQPLVLKGKESVCTGDADALRGKGSGQKGVVNDVANKLTAPQVRLINDSIRKQFGMNLTPDKTSFTKPANPAGRSCVGKGMLATYTSGRHYEPNCMQNATPDRKPIHLKVSGGKLYYVTDHGINFAITACVHAGGLVTLNAYSNESNAQYVGNKIVLTSRLKGDTSEITIQNGFKELIGKSSVKVPREAVAGEDARSVASAQ